MSISPRMFPCEICGGIFPVDTFAFHNCEETKKKIAKEKAIIENWLKSNKPLTPTTEDGAG